VAAELPEYPGLTRVVFCCFGAETTATYRRVLAELAR
jgi:hypothetical protein